MPSERPTSLSVVSIYRRSTSHNPRQTPCETTSEAPAVVCLPSLRNHPKMKRSKPLFDKNSPAIVPDLLGTGPTPTANEQTAEQLYRLLRDEQRENARLIRQLSKVEAKLKRLEAQMRRWRAKGLMKKFYSRFLVPHEVTR